jgi:hypothetical protein
MKNINVFKIYSARLQTLATSAARGPQKMGHDKNKLAPARFKNKLTAARFRIAQNILRRKNVDSSAKRSLSYLCFLTE